jgi:phosphomannomutase
VALVVGTRGARDLRDIIKAYDVRGVVPDQLDASVARAIGVAAARVIVEPGQTSIVVGHDMRPSAADLVGAFVDGVTSQGIDVVVIGLAATDELYFASGYLDAPGAMFTASHNPARYNGIKFCRSGARPVSQASGLADITTIAESVLAGTDDGAPAPTPGTATDRDLLPAYAEYLHGLVDLSGIRPLTVVVDAGNGMAGHTVPAVLGTDEALTVVPMYFELDGTFPNHDANPLDVSTLVDLQARVREAGADLGLAFDGDADRCMVIDQAGDVVSPSAVTGLIATRELERNPGARIVHNLITSRAVPEIIAEHGGVPVRTRVGHSLIKKTMADTDAVFGGEHSAHFYFRDFWRADSGMLAALHVLAALGRTKAGTTVTRLLAPFERYAGSGEINSTVSDTAAATAAVESRYSGGDVDLDHLDGLTVTHRGEPMWWFNLRPSNTEPLLRLNVEGADSATMERIRDEVLAVVRGT